MKKVRIQYWYGFEWCLSGIMLMSDAVRTLPAYKIQYKDAEIVDLDEIDSGCSNSVTNKYLNKELGDEYVYGSL